VATNGQTIVLGFGTFDLGTNILVPKVGVSIVGQGKGNTILLGYADCSGVEEGWAPTGGPQISLCDNVYLAGFDLMCDTNSMVPLTTTTHSGTWSGIGVSRYNPPSNRNFTNVVVEDVRILRGYFDGFHFNNDSNCTFTARRCTVDLNGGDCINAVLGDPTNPAGGQTNSLFSFYDCSFKTTNDAVYTTLLAAGVVVGQKAVVTASKQLVSLINCVGSTAGKLVAANNYPAPQVSGGDYRVVDTYPSFAQGSFLMNYRNYLVGSNGVIRSLSANLSIPSAVSLNFNAASVSGGSQFQIDGTRDIILGDVAGARNGTTLGVSDNNSRVTVSAASGLLNQFGRIEGDGGVLAPFLEITSNTFPVTSWTPRNGNRAWCITWLSNFTCYLICTNPVAKTAYTNKLGGL